MTVRCADLCCWISVWLSIPSITRYFCQFFPVSLLCHHSSTALSWFQSYQTNRTQTFHFAGSQSPAFPVDSSVPQGSLLVDWLIEQGLTSHQTHYRSYRGRFCQVIMTKPTVSKHWKTSRICWTDILKPFLVLPSCSAFRPQECQ